MPCGEPARSRIRKQPDMSKRAELSTGEALVGLLEAYGVDTIFGIPGVHNVEMYRALPRSRIQPRAGAPRTGRGLHGRWLCPRHRQARRVLHHHRPRPHQHPHAAWARRGPTRAPCWSSPPPSTSRDSAQGRGRLHEMIDQRGAAATVTSLTHARLYAEGRARCGGPRLRQFRQPAAAPRLYRDSARPSEGARRRRLDGARACRNRPLARCRADRCGGGQAQRGEDAR